jgi:hypothetical protein
MKIVKALLIGSLVFGAVSPVRAEYISVESQSAKIQVARDRVTMSGFVVKAVRLNTLLVRGKYEEYVNEAPDTILTWEAAKNSYRHMPNHEYLDKAIQVHRFFFTALDSGNLSQTVVDIILEDSQKHIKQYRRLS